MLWIRHVERTESLLIRGCRPERRNGRFPARAKRPWATPHEAPQHNPPHEETTRKSVTKSRQQNTAQDTTNQTRAETPLEDATKLRDQPHDPGTTRTVPSGSRYLIVAEGTVMEPGFVHPLVDRPARYCSHVSWFMCLAVGPVTTPSVQETTNKQNNQTPRKQKAQRFSTLVRILQAIADLFGVFDCFFWVPPQPFAQF